MTMQSFFILTAAQAGAFSTWDSDAAALGARPIDGASPGNAINTNADATGYDLGDSIDLAVGGAYGTPGDYTTWTGLFIANPEIVSDPQYQMYDPNLVAVLPSMPQADLDLSVIFAPPPAP